MIIKVPCSSVVPAQYVRVFMEQIPLCVCLIILTNAIQKQALKGAFFFDCECL